MRRFTRVAGYAAAALTITSGVGNPDPSRARDVHLRPVAVADVEALVSGPATIEPSDPAASPSADAPLDAPPATLADLVTAHSTGATTDAEHECLAGAVYFESKGEPLQGQLAVAEVVLNRARSGRFPASICGVVKQRGQFSFIRGGRFPAIARGSPAWRKAVGIARIALADLAEGVAPRALFFHATYVAPRWRGLTRIATVGNHVFYR